MEKEEIEEIKNKVIDELLNDLSEDVNAVEDEEDVDEEPKTKNKKTINEKRLRRLEKEVIELKRKIYLDGLFKEFEEGNIEKDDLIYELMMLYGVGEAEELPKSVLRKIERIEAKKEAMIEEKEAPIVKLNPEDVEYVNTLLKAKTWYGAFPIKEVADRLKEKKITWNMFNDEEKEEIAKRLSDEINKSRDWFNIVGYDEDELKENIEYLINKIEADKEELAKLMKPYIELEKEEA